MNFVKLYIGDYQRDTGHLSIAEHGAYLLMLQHFYATEKPLPTGKALHRLLRAESKAEREAIDCVVRQFWTEADGGLVNGRAREEMAKAADSEEGAEARRVHERERQQRARERRSAMYAQLRSRGITPPFDATTAQLRSLLDTSVTQPVTRDDHASVTQKVTQPVTRDVTANHSHSQTPDLKPKPLASAVPSSVEPGPAGALSRALRAKGIASNPMDPRLQALAEAGTTPQLAMAAADAARDAKGPNARIPPAYVLAILERWRTEPAAIPAAAQDPNAAAAEALRMLEKRDAEIRTA